MVRGSKRGILSWLFGGFALCKLRISFSKIRFWKWRTPGRNPDIDKDI